MSGYEEQPHARAEMLEETSELAAAVTAILDGASGAGADPEPIWTESRQIARPGSLFCTELDLPIR